MPMACFDPPSTWSLRPSIEMESVSPRDSCLTQLSCVDPENALKLRDSTINRTPGIKGQKMCCFTQCPSPMHSKKWRIVTKGTRAGARDWALLLGQTLCDSCYSTFRKHGTFNRSVRTTKGWSRVESYGSQPSKILQDTKRKDSLETEEAKNVHVLQDREDRRPVMLRSLHKKVRFCQIMLSVSQNGVCHGQSVCLYGKFRKAFSPCPTPACMQTLTDLL